MLRIIFLLLLLLNQQVARAQEKNFFRIEKIDDKWQIIDPEGNIFHMRGANHYGSGDHMPWNLAERYETVDKWRASLKERHRAWGFTYLPPSIGPNVIQSAELQDHENRIVREPEWSDESFASLDFPFTAFLEVPKQYMAGEGMPDVFGEKFKNAVDQRCREFVEPLKDNKFLIGYHFAHNPPWNINAASAEDWIEACTQPGSAGRKAWARHMQQVYGTINRWRKTYGVPIEDWSDIEKLDRPLRGYVSGNRLREDKESFLQQICRQWYRVYHDAIRKYDENHLILGDRNTLHLQAAPSPWAYHIMNQYVDVLSVNVMGPAETLYEVLEGATRNWDGPILLADTGAGVYEGDPAKAGYQAKDLEEFELVYGGLIEMSIQHPQIVGFGWCGWFETPNPRGRSGLVSVADDQPLTERIEIVKKWNDKMNQYVEQLNSQENR